MNRLKFLVFALVALGLWGHLFGTRSREWNQSASAVAADTLATSAEAVALPLEARRSELQGALLRLSGDEAMRAPARGGRLEAPTVERFNALREVVLAGLSEGSRGRLVMAVRNDAGALLARGAGDAVAPEGVDLVPLVAAGPAGALTTFDGAPALFYAMPLLTADRGEVRGDGTVLVGLPLLPDADALGAIARARGLETLAVLREGAVVVAGGNAGLVAGAVATLKPGAVGPLATGAARILGPLELPLLVGPPALSVGARQQLAGTPYEVLAVTSTSAAMARLAAFQIFSLGAVVGLLLLAVVVLTLLGAPEEEGARLVLPTPMPVPTVGAKRDEPPAPEPLPMPEPAPAAEASPDDFDFPASSPSTMQATTSQVPAYAPSDSMAAGSALGVASTASVPAFDPFASAPPVPDAADPFDPFAAMGPAPTHPPYPGSAPAFPDAPAAPQPSATLQQDDDAGERTLAYPVKPGADPFAMAASQFPEEASSYEDSAESTRVAAVPAELIKQARAGVGSATEPGLRRPASLSGTGSVPRVQSVPAVSAASDEERHFQDVFREFVATRERCGEASEGLTYEKFKAKLLKNKEQLVAKYHCRTVRFQAYVKDGKAALKATPVKD